MMNKNISKSCNPLPLYIGIFTFYRFINYFYRFTDYFKIPKNGILCFNINYKAFIIKS